MKSKPCVIVSTCGTSMLTNCAELELRSFLVKVTNKRGAELQPEDKARIDAHVSHCLDRLLQADLPETARISAELNGILALYGWCLPQETKNRHIFVQTDTYLGQCCVDLLNVWMQHKGLQHEHQHIPGLNTQSLEDFSAAMSELARWCHDYISPLQGPHTHIVFNLTGGFKGVQGYMQTLGMLYADEVVYIFERSGQLLRIPRLPLDIGGAAQEVIKRNLLQFRCMALDIHVRKDACPEIPQSMIDDMDEEHCSLSPWGLIFWNTYKDMSYSRELVLPLPLPQMKSSQKFLESVQTKANQAQYIKSINERMDDLAVFLQRGENPSRLSFKKLQAALPSGSTHECYAWSTSGAWRIMCHFEGKDCHLDMLREHL